MTDQEFIQGIRDKDPAAFDFIYQKQYWQLVYFAQNLSCSKEDARDIVSEAFARLWIKRKMLESLQHAEHFLYKLVRQAAIDHLRKMQTRTKAEQLLKTKITISEATIERKYQEAQLTRMLLERVNQLPPQMQLIFRLTYLEGMSRAEVAQKLNISENTVRNTNLKTMNMLRVAFGTGKNDKMVVVALIAFLLLASR